MVVVGWVVALPMFLMMIGFLMAGFKNDPDRKG